MVNRWSHGAIVLKQWGKKEGKEQGESVRTRLQDFGLPHMQEEALSP